MRAMLISPSAGWVAATASTSRGAHLEGAGLEEIRFPASKEHAADLADALPIPDGIEPARSGHLGLASHADHGRPFSSTFGAVLPALIPVPVSGLVERTLPSNLTWIIAQCAQRSKRGAGNRLRLR